MLNAVAQLFLCGLRARASRAKDLTQLRGESGPVGQVVFVVKVPRLGNVAQVERDIEQLHGVVPPVESTHPVVIIEPVLDVVPA